MSDWRSATDEDARAVDKLHERIRERGGDIRHPKIIDTEYGKRAWCLECGDSVQIFGYIQHFVRAHETLLESVDSLKFEQPPIPHMYIVNPYPASRRAQLTDWNEMARESRAKILAKYGRNVVK